MTVPTCIEIRCRPGQGNIVAGPALAISFISLSDQPETVFSYAMEEYVIRGKDFLIASGSSARERDGFRPLLQYALVLSPMLEAFFAGSDLPGHVDRSAIPRRPGLSDRDRSHGSRRAWGTRGVLGRKGRLASVHFLVYPVEREVHQRSRGQDPFLEAVGQGRGGPGGSHLAGGKPKPVWLRIPHRRGGRSSAPTAASSYADDFDAPLPPDVMAAFDSGAR